MHLLKVLFMFTLVFVAGSDLCTDLCSGQDDTSMIGEQCSDQYCLCYSSGNFVLDCEASYGWCPFIEECVQKCNESCLDYCGVLIIDKALS